MISQLSHLNLINVSITCLYFILFCIYLRSVCTLLLNICAFSVSKRITYTHSCALFILNMCVDVSNKMIIAYII